MLRINALVAKEFNKKNDKDNFNCEDLVQCVFDLNELEFNIYCALLKMEEGNIGRTVNEIQNFVHRKEKTMVNRALKKLNDLGLVKRESISSQSDDQSIQNQPTPKRGYFYVYKPLSLDGLILEMRDRLDKWYDKATIELHNIKNRFREKIEIVHLLQQEVAD